MSDSVCVSLKSSHPPLLGVPHFSAIPPVVPSSTTPPTPLTGIRPNPCATPHWGGPSGHLADPTPNTRTKKNEDQARHRSVENSTTSSTLQKRFVQTCTKPTSLRSFYPREQENTFKPKPITKSKERMGIFDSGAFLVYDGEVFCLFLFPQEQENHTTDQKLPDDPNREWHRPLHDGGDALYPGARHLLEREVGGRLAGSFLSWTIVCAMNGSFPSLCNQEEAPTLTKGKRPSRAARTISLLSSRSPTRRLLHLSGTTPSHRVSPCAQQRGEGNHATIAGTFVESLSTTTQYKSRIHLQPKKKRSQERPHCSNRSSLGCNTCAGKTLMLKTQRRA